MCKIIGPLTDPARFGADPADVFDVVIPSIPGYGFSGPTRTRGGTGTRIAEIFAILMQELGYQRFGAQGGDWGSSISATLGRSYPDKLVGIHLNFLLLRSSTGQDATKKYAPGKAAHHRPRCSQYDQATTLPNDPSGYLRVTKAVWHGNSVSADASTGFY